MRASHRDTLQLDEDPAFQERWWHWERYAWVAFGLIILSALAGLTGLGGPLAQGSATAATGYIEYPRATRWQADDKLQVRFAPAAGETRTLGLSNAFIALFQIVDVEPWPIRTVATSDGIDFLFAARAGSEAEVHLALRSQHPGIVSFYAAIDGKRINATTFALP